MKGRGGSGSLLDSLKASSKGSPDIVQKGIIAPLTSSPQSSAFSKAPVLPKAGGEPRPFRVYFYQFGPLKEVYLITANGPCQLILVNEANLQEVPTLR